MMKVLSLLFYSFLISAGNGIPIKKVRQKLTLLINLFLTTQTPFCFSHSKKVKNVNVIGHCMFQFDNNVIVVKEGSTVKLKCGASGTPKLQVTWTKLNEMEVLGSGEVLELAKVRREKCSGKLQCCAGVQET